MTSTNDGKEVKSNQTSGHKGKSYYIDLYKSLEKHLSEECELSVRNHHLCSAWRRVHSLCQHSVPNTHSHYLSWLQRHTANTLLQSEWQSEKDEQTKLQEAIDAFIAESNAAAASRHGPSPEWESQLVLRGEWFKTILANPWGHPVLKVLCDPRGEPPSDEDILEWLKEEREVMFVARLRHLAASKKCHEIALALVTAVMDRQRACETLVPDAEQTDQQEPAKTEGGTSFKEILESKAGFTKDVWPLLTDLELVLLHKRNEHAQCIALAKKIPLRSGYSLVERLRKRPETLPREKKLWKNAVDVATLVAQVVITRCMVVPVCAGAVYRALYQLGHALVRLLPAAALPAAARALAAPAATARHLHTLAEAVRRQLHDQKAEDMNSFVCELYVRAITAGMNELEKLKLKTEKESEARSMERTLASWFTSLGSLLSRSARMQCECVLTAFSVHPSADMFDKIRAAPDLPRKLDPDKQEPKEESQSEFGSWASDSRSQTNLVKTSETLNIKQTQQLTNVMSTAIFAEGEAIGLSAELCQDLTVCLSGPRIKTLSWDIDRASLVEKCRSHMERTAGGTRLPSRELRFLNLDPSKYLHLPEEADDEADPHYGIERGYEHLVEWPEEADWEDPFDHEATETAYSSEELVDIPVRRKKKTKRTAVISEESDPLSSVTESNKGDKKKERPHSKERSKERKKKHKDPEDKEEKKEKKVRKKKEPAVKHGSLASLIGIKVSTANATDLGLTITDSDYDSQGKSSLASDGNDPNVVYDGLFNMDDPLSDKPVVNSKSTVLNGEAVNKAPRKKPIVKKKHKNTTMPETKPQTAKPANIFMNYAPKRPSAVGVVSEQVKKSIAKLLQFRRNQNAGLLHKNTQMAPKADPKPANAIYKPEFPTQQVISPKSVIIPEIPKSYINKELIDADRNRSVILNQMQTNATVGQSLNRDNDTHHNRQPMQDPNKSSREVIVPPARSSAGYSSPENKDNVTFPQYYPNFDFNLHSVPNILSKTPGLVQPKNISMSLSRVETPMAQKHAKSYDDFLIDLKAAANSVSAPSVIAKKDVKPVSRVPSMTSSLPYTDTTISLQCAKQVPQKKVENAPNTFSRLSYMKNKQSDLKQKQALETQSVRQEELGLQNRTSLELSRCLTEFKNTKIKYIKTKGETVITRVDNPLNLSCGNSSVDRKAENNPSTSRGHPVITNLLQHTPVSRFDNVDPTKVTTPAKKSYLSEKDQNDLVLLLRQQNRINSITNVSRTPPAPQAPVNMTMENASNIISSPAVVSKPMQRTSVINNPIQIANTIESKETKSVEIKPVKNTSRNASNSGGRGKKASKTNTGEKSHSKTKTKRESNITDWQLVMNAIIAQKTPSRGPSALELPMNCGKKLSDHSLRNQRIVRTNSVGETDKISKTVDTVISNANNVEILNPSVAAKSLPKTSCNKEVVKSSVKIQNETVIIKTAQPDTQNTSDEYKKSVKSIPVKRSSGEVEKMVVGGEKNKFTTTISKNEDPFISGKEEDNLSDLDDLFDDELRREIEESYRTSQEPKGNKTLPCSKSDTSNKQDIGNVPQKEKIQIPDVLRSLMERSHEISILDVKNMKSKDCVRNQTNKFKSKALVHNVQIQCISKATSNETLNKNDIGTHKTVPQVTDTKCYPDKNLRKVSDPAMHYQYISVNKPVQQTEMLNEVVNNVTRNRCLNNQYPSAANKNTSNVEQPKKVYVVPALTQPASNILILGSEMYYNPIPIIQNNINSNVSAVNPLFVQQSNTLNIVIPQPAYCAPSISSSHLNTVPVSVTTPSINLSFTNQNECVPKTTIFPPDAETAYVEAITTTEQPKQNNTSTLNNDVSFDINPNKNSELYSLADTVQENKDSNATNRLSRSRSVSTEEVLRDILNDQEIDQNVVGKKVMYDKTEPYPIKDIERLKRKRLAIINRQLIQSCIYPTIALSYAPLNKKSSHIKPSHNKSQILDAETEKDTSHGIIESTIKDETYSIHVNKTKSDKLQTIVKIGELIADTTKQPSPLFNQESNDDHPKENTSSTMKCRSILLRSSNKKLPKIPTEVKDQNPIARKTKVRLKVAKLKDDKNKIEINEDAIKPKTDKEHELMPSKTNNKKKGKRKPVVLKKLNEVLDTKKQEKNENLNCSLDIEDALSSSLIPNVKNDQSHSLPASDAGFDNVKSISTKPDNIVILPNKKVEVIAPQMSSIQGCVDNKSKLISDKVVILQNKKVLVRRKRKSKIIETSSNTTDCTSKTPIENNDTNIGTKSNVSDNQRVLRSVTKTPVDKSEQEICQAETTKTATIMSKNKLTTVPKVSPVHVTRQELSYSIVNNVRMKAEETKQIDELTKVIPDSTNLCEPSGKVNTEDKKSENKTFQSILENFIVSNDHVFGKPNKSQIINEIDTKKIEHSKQNIDGEIQSTTKINRDSQVSAKSVLCSSNVTSNTETHKILHDKGQLSPFAKTRSSKIVPTGDIGNNVKPQLPPKPLPQKQTNQSKSIDTDKRVIPQSYKDSIIIEEIPNSTGSDATKLLRIKLPNGKIFKASVYGKMHTSFDSLFDDPSLRAMLMTDLNEQRKYTLNIKQVSKTKRGNPDQPIETRIQEIHVNSKALAPAVVETIDLLSDDEENSDICSFKTKSGVYKTTIKDKEIVTKHQAKFDQCCLVKLNRLVLHHLNTCPDNSESDVIEVESGSDGVQDNCLPPVYLNKENETMQSSTLDVQNNPWIDPPQNNATENRQDNSFNIDESSNDSIDLLKNCPDLPIDLILGVPLNSNNVEILDNDKNEHETGILTLETTDTINKNLELTSLNNENVSTTLEAPTIGVTEMSSNEHDDDKYKDMTNNEKILNDEGKTQSKVPDTSGPPDFIDDNKTDLSEKLTIKYRECYLSLSRCEDLVEYYNIQNALNRQCSVSLERCDSLIESFKTLENDVDTKEIIEKESKKLENSVEMSDTDVSSTASISILNDLSFASETDHEVSPIESGRNSPVIEVFEVIASLRNKLNTEVKNACDGEKFECAWFITKKQMHYEYKQFEVQENNEDFKPSCSQQIKDVPIKQQDPCNIVPSLASLSTVFFQTCDILERLQLVLKQEHRTNKRKDPTPCLKRKMPNLADNIIASKVSKSEETNVLRADSVEDSPLPSDVFTNENKNVIIENELQPITMDVSELKSMDIQSNTIEITYGTADNYINTCSDVVPGEVTEIVQESCVIENEMECEMIKNSSVNQSNVALQECQEHEITTKIGQDNEEFISNEIAENTSNNTQSKTTENITNEYKQGRPENNLEDVTMEAIEDQNLDVSNDDDSKNVQNSEIFKEHVKLNEVKKLVESNDGYNSDNMSNVQKQVKVENILEDVIRLNEDQNLDDTNGSYESDNKDNVQKQEIADEHVRAKSNDGYNSDNVHNVQNQDTTENTLEDFIRPNEDINLDETNDSHDSDNIYNVQKQEIADKHERANPNDGYNSYNLHIVQKQVTMENTLEDVIRPNEDQNLKESSVSIQHVQKEEFLEDDVILNEVQNLDEPNNGYNNSDNMHNVQKQEITENDLIPNEFQNSDEPNDGYTNSDYKHNEQKQEISEIDSSPNDYQNFNRRHSGELSSSACDDQEKCDEIVSGLDQKCNDTNEVENSQSIISSGLDQQCYDTNEVENSQSISSSGLDQQCYDTNEVENSQSISSSGLNQLCNDINEVEKSQSISSSGLNQQCYEVVNSQSISSSNTNCDEIVPGLDQQCHDTNDVENSQSISSSNTNCVEIVPGLDQQCHDTNEVENSQSISSSNTNLGGSENHHHGVKELVEICDVEQLDTEGTKVMIESKEHELESEDQQIDEIINDVTSPDKQNTQDSDEGVDSDITENENRMDEDSEQLPDITVREFLNDVLYVTENNTTYQNVILNCDDVVSVNKLDTEDNSHNQLKQYEFEDAKNSQLVDSTVKKDSVVGQNVTTTEVNKFHSNIIDDAGIVREIADIDSVSCVALEVTCGDAENSNNDQIELSLLELISDEIKVAGCDKVIPEDEKRVTHKCHDHIAGLSAIPDHDYICERHRDETTETQTLNKLEINKRSDDDVTSNDENPECGDESDRDKCLLEGVAINDPEVGILYVLYPIDDNTSETGTLNGSFDDENETFEDNEDIDDAVDNILGDKDINKEILKVNIPKMTYSKLPTCGLTFKQNLKRKIEVTHSKFATKRYRKGKNIDYPKITAAAILEQGYTKEYKRVFDYSSSLKFSLTQPFHKEYVDMDIAIKNWPIKGPCVSQPDLATESQCVLFVDTQTNRTYEPLALKQTLEEEINQNYTENTEPSTEINEINFNMGFGEGSGRVIQNLEDVGDISKVSAATLSDVKQTQPFLLSEDCKDNLINSNDAKYDQSQKLQRYLSFIKLHNKVKSFFEKNLIELTNDGLSKKKEDASYNTFDTTNFPFDFYIQDFMEPHPFEAIVQVVQVGQLPVSAAAQNPVTCDPRVTQVSDASPSQCSAENSPHDESSTPIKTEYTELTTADLSLPMVQEYAHHAQTMSMDSHEKQNAPFSDENIPIETEIKSVIKIELTEELPEEKELKMEPLENSELNSMEEDQSNTEYAYDTNDTSTPYDMNNVTTEYENATTDYHNTNAEYDNATNEYNTPTAEYETTNHVVLSEDVNEQMMHNSSEKQTAEDEFPQEKQQNSSEKTDQIAHAMSAAGITTTADAVADDATHALFSKTTSINAMTLQQALAQILPPPLNPTNGNDNKQQTNTPQVLHIVQGKNASGNQITLVDNQHSVISGTNATPVLHIVQNKSGTTGATSNGTPGTQTNSFSGLSLVDAGLQQGGNQLLHIVNTGNQKNNTTGQLLKRVNLLTNLANVQGSNEQKMVQFVCKSADGKSIQLNGPHQRSMVLRLQPIESPAAQPKHAENQEAQESPSPSTAQNKDGASQQEIKSRSVYEENYAKFIQNSSPKPAAAAEKSTSLPKFNQAFGKPVFQEGAQKPNEVSDMPSVNTPSENNECPSTDNNSINLEHINQISSPPLLLRKSPAQTSQAETNLVQQIKQTIAPMNIQTMHGGVIYTRQIPVNIGGGQTISLITVPSTELIGESGQKQQSGTQGEMEPSIIKIVPQTQTNNNSEISSEENGNNMNASNENNQNPQPHPQPVLTQMRIKLPMLSKTPQMVSGARVVRPSFFQIQRNVIGGNNQPVYQQLVLTAAPPLGQQTIRLPTVQANRSQLKVPSETQSTESMSSSTLEQLREFDMVLEQVKERSTVQPNSNSNTTSFPKIHTPSSDTTDGVTSAATTPSESNQVLYSIGNNQQLNVAYVNRKITTTTPTTSTFVRSPDSSGIADSPTSSTHVSIPHTVTTESTSSDTPPERPKPAKVSSKSKSRPKSSSHPPNNMKINPVPPKTSTQKPLEDEQTTQRILYILAEYKEQVENSPDKDKPAPRRRTHPPSNPGSSKRKKSCSGSRHRCRDLSPVHGEDTCRTMGSEDSSCGTSQGDCNESCLDSHSPQDSPRKIVRKLTFEHETPAQQPRPQPQRNVIVADGQTITVARGTAGKPTTAVLMPANYILPVSMVKGGQQIAIVTNRGPKLLTVSGGEGGATNALLLQRLIGPGLKPVLARPGVRHVRLPTAALHNLQAFNLAAATNTQPPDSTASPASAPTPDLVETRAGSSPWTDRESQDVKPERGSSPEGSEPWNLPASADPHDYTYEETVRADNMDRTVLDAMQDRYSPEMEAQRIFDKMFDVDSKKSYIDSPRCGYDIDASDCDDKAYHQVVQKKEGSLQRHHRLTHVSAAALRHKYAILEHELRLQKSLSEECEDLGVDSPSASELFPEAELLFAASPAHEHTQDQGQTHTPQPVHPGHSVIPPPQPDMDDQIATDQLLGRDELERDQLELGLEDVQHMTLDHEEFARAHPNTTFHSEPTDDTPAQPFTIAGLKGRHITSTIFHSNRAPATVLMTAPQTTVISQATAEPHVKYDLDMINSIPSSHNINLPSVLVKDDGLTRFDSILNDSRELHLTQTASAIVHSTGNATQVIRRVCYDDKRDNSFLMDEPDALIAGDDAKMIAEDSSRDATLESMADVDDDRSSPERHTELFWESNSASERSESRRPLDFSSDSDKCCKSPSYDETNSTDSSGVGTHMRLDSVIKDARGMDRSGSGDGSSAEDAPPRARALADARSLSVSLSGKTRAGEHLERRRASARGVVKRGCHCCNGDPAPPRPKKSRQRKPNVDFPN